MATKKRVRRKAARKKSGSRRGSRTTCGGMTAKALAEWQGVGAYNVRKAVREVDAVRDEIRKYLEHEQAPPSATLVRMIRTWEERVRTALAKLDVAAEPLVKLREAAGEFREKLDDMGDTWYLLLPGDLERTLQEEIDRLSETM